MAPVPKVAKATKRFALKPDALPLFGFLPFRDVVDGCNTLGLSVKATLPFVLSSERLTMWRKGCAGGRLDVIKRLISLDRSHLHDTLAKEAAMVHGQVHILIFLLRQGAWLPELPVRPICGYHDSTLAQVVKNGHLNVLLLLASRYFYFRKRDDALLHCAAYYGQVDIILFLLARDLDVHSQNDLALYYAVYRGHQPAVKVLLENGANPTALDPVYNKPRVLMWLYDRTDILRLLLDAGLSADRVALTEMACADNVHCFQLLQAAGADVHAHLDRLLRIARGTRVLPYLLGLVHDLSSLLLPLQNAVADRHYHKIKAYLAHGFTPAALGRDPDYLQQFIVSPNRKATKLFAKYGWNVPLPSAPPRRSSRKK